MKTKKVDFFDNLIYVLLCILTLGWWWAMRVMITKAIIMAVEEK